MSVVLQIGARSLTWSELDQLARGDALVDHTEKLSPKVKGEGIKVSALFPDLPSDITHIMFDDGGDYRACVPRAEALDTAVLAHRLDGAPLPEKLGGPLRLLVPSSENLCLSVKHVRRITPLDHAEVDTVPRPTTPLRAR